MDSKLPRNKTEWESTARAEETPPLNADKFALRSASKWRKTEYTRFRVLQMPEIQGGHLEISSQHRQIGISDELWAKAKGILNAKISYQNYREAIESKGAERFSRDLNEFELVFRAYLQTADTKIEVLDSNIAAARVSTRQQTTQSTPIRRRLFGERDTAAVDPSISPSSMSPLSELSMTPDPPSPTPVRPDPMLGVEPSLIQAIPVTPEGQRGSVHIPGTGDLTSVASAGTSTGSEYPDPDGDNFDRGEPVVNVFMVNLTIAVSVLCGIKADSPAWTAERNRFLFERGHLKYEALTDGHLFVQRDRGWEVCACIEVKPRRRDNRVRFQEAAQLIAWIQAIGLRSHELSTLK